VENVFDFYSNQEEITKTKLKEILTACSASAHRFNNYENPGITLYHGADSFKVVAEINDTFDAVEKLPEYGILVKDLINWGNNIKFENKEEELAHNWLIQIRTTLFYTWLSKIWVDLDAQAFNIRVSTLENSYINEFILNDLSWMEQSSHKAYCGRTARMAPFNRKLSTIEIYRRVNLGGRSLWDCNYRQFSSDSLNIEMIIGRNEVILKEENKIVEDHKFQNKKERNYWIKNKTDEMVNNNIYEQITKSKRDQ